MMRGQVTVVNFSSHVLNGHLSIRRKYFISDLVGYFFVESNLRLALLRRMKFKAEKNLWTLWSAIFFATLMVSFGKNYSRHHENGRKRHMLSFRPLHFAAVDLPLGNKPFHQDESTPNAGAFKIDNGGVVGAGTYEVSPDGVDLDLNLKIPSKAPNEEGRGEAAPPGSPEAPGSPGSPFEQEGLNKHNEFRNVHGVPPMTLNAEMSQQAAAYAQKIANLGTLQHASREERNGDGENLSMGCSTKKGQTAAEAVTNWYNEVCSPGYTFGRPSGSPGTGHFTQVVWKGSTQLGMGMAESQKSGMKCTYIVGRYREAGNMMGDYAENVPKGSFNKAQACANVRGGFLDHLSLRSRTAA
ncbi:probable pathogenesis-related protein CaO19.6200 isoform X5 [Acropora millepora]|uniref:probable pathogenesis-related protein CaO19.6200 isoform X5 n=1 Tax=Acropora millepora TaxID=45264 RepID=UPI001CF1FD55|nr:probable pathogenesis-related protein CaO19.6200 isoform X5 [Acropora millepora]